MFYFAPLFVILNFHMLADFVLLSVNKYYQTSQVTKF